MDFLKKGDVFVAPKGMKVHYPKFPIRLYPRENIFSDRISDACIEIGTCYSNRTDATHERWVIKRDITELFMKNEILYDYEIVQRFVNHQVKDPKPVRLTIPDGYYIVTNVEVKLGATDRKVFCQT